MAELADDSYIPLDRPSRATPLFTALILTSVGLLLAGLVSVAALSTSATNSPEDAVRSLLQAAAVGDVNGALAAIDPNESAAMRPALTSITDDLKTLGVLDPSADLSHVPGLSAQFSHVELKTERIDPSRDDLAAVTFTEGTVTANLDSSLLPLGALLKSFLVGSGAPSSLTRSAPLATPDTAKTPLVTVNRGGQWFVSIGYSVAEAARRQSGQAFPAAGSSVAATGASSAEDAVRQLVAAATSADIRKVIALVNPDDLGALHDYASLYLDHVPSSPPAAITVSQLDLTTSSVADGTLVTVKAFSASGGGVSVSMPPGGCVHVSDQGVDRNICPPAGSNLGAGLGVVTVEHGGVWYVDPIRTVFDDTERVLSGLNLSQLVKAVRSGGLVPAGVSGLLGGQLGASGASVIQSSPPS